MTASPSDPAPLGAPAEPASVPARPPRAPLSVKLLAVIAVGIVLWAAQAVLLPILVAVFLSLVGNPVIRALRRVHLSRALASVLVMLVGLGLAGLVATRMLPAAVEWAHEAPHAARQMAPKLRELLKPVQDAGQAAESFARAAGGQMGRAPDIVHTAQDDPFGRLLATPRALAAVLAVALLTFFFMVFGERLWRNAVALLPEARKPFAEDILHSIEHEISRYVLTISLINAALGTVYGSVLYLLHFPPSEAVLWGTLAALLNFAPYVGPLIGVLLMLLVGLATFDDLGASLLPAAIYLGLHTLEGQLVTPVVLGKRMALSPLVLMLALMLFGGLWGFVGLLLAVPLLVCIKLVLARVDGLQGWAQLLE